MLMRDVRMKLTAKDEERRRKYFQSEPKHLGNLHERMRYAMDLLEQECETVGDALWDALFDLELEVSYHVPQTPPYGQRGVNMLHYRHRIRGRKANA